MIFATDAQTERRTSPKQYASSTFSNMGNNYTLVQSKLIIISFKINKKCPNTLNPPGSDYRATLQQTFGLQSNAIPSEILCSSVRTYTPEFRFINTCKIVRAVRNWAWFLCSTIIGLKHQLLASQQTTIYFRVLKQWKVLYILEFS